MGNLARLACFLHDKEPLVVLDDAFDRGIFVTRDQREPVSA